eukprot:3480497-Amphidinium_carterae.1
MQQRAAAFPGRGQPRPRAQCAAQQPPRPGAAPRAPVNRRGAAALAARFGVLGLSTTATWTE